MHFAASTCFYESILQEILKEQIKWHKNVLNNICLVVKNQKTEGSNVTILKHMSIMLSTRNNQHM